MTQPKTPKTKPAKVPPIPPMKESMLVNLILRDLLSRYKGVLRLWRNNSGAFKTEGGNFIRYGALGSPDILGILKPGKIVCIEAKSSRGKLSEHQERWLQEARDLGALVGVVRSVDEAIALIESGLNSGEVTK